MEQDKEQNKKLNKSGVSSITEMRRRKLGAEEFRRIWSRIRIRIRSRSRNRNSARTRSKNRIRSRSREGQREGGAKGTELTQGYKKELEH